MLLYLLAQLSCVQSYMFVDLPQISCSTMLAESVMVPIEWFQAQDFTLCEVLAITLITLVFLMMIGSIVVITPWWALSKAGRDISSLETSSQNGSVGYISRISLEEYERQRKTYTEEQVCLLKETAEYKRKMAERGTDERLWNW